MGNFATEKCNKLIYKVSGWAHEQNRGNKGKNQ